ncbi:hypothetical protein J6500_06485 [Bradyrhizobium sp. WSM 1704]|uniref:hypothetical protein n=1 Tax=Bradyrhizobium semiaridum TaxID=2821404 RepID=UPI001CE2AB8E|nr:hypothetical protein [Bradyrhizobium semiaridum]MCA6121554.1 hypothetical protein [Bradyrhizobium semiaridum]
MARNVLLGNMACLADFGNPNQRYQDFLQRGLPPFKTLIESILLFDKITIPTNDFMPLALLLGVLGEDHVARLLGEDIIAFARFTGSVAYLGNGGGVGVINVADSDKTPKLFSAPTEITITELFKGLPGLKNERLLKNLALRSTVEFSIESSQGELGRAVYEEIKREPSIVKARGIVNLAKLPGLAPNQVRGLSLLIDDEQDDDIFQVLRVAQSNLEAKAAALTGWNDIYTSEEVAKLFRNSLSRVRPRADSEAKLATLVSIADLPDVGLLAIQNKEIIRDIISLRQSVSGTQFRMWFHENCRTDPKTTSREYQAVLKSIPFVQSATGRTLRYFTQLGVAAAAMPLDPTIGLGIGAALGALDSFILERTFKGSSPKVFMERLEKIAVEITAEQA